MGGPRSSGSTTAAGPPAQPEWVPSTYSTRNVEVRERPADRVRSQATEAAFKDLKKAIAKENIPAPGKSASGMVSGFTAITSDGVNVTFGESWEKEGYQMKDLRTRDRQASRNGRPVVMNWTFPSKIIVEGGVSNFHNPTRVEGWVGRIRSLGESLGLVATSSSPTRVVLELPRR